MFRRLIALFDPFLIALIGTVALATLFPVHGLGARIASGVSTALILLLFFFHGAKLSREAILGGIRNVRLHGLILLSTFVLFPLLGLALASSLPDIMPRALWIGVLFLCALPATVQSAIAFTSMARGDVPAAIASASASQVLGVFITPVLIGLLAGVHGGAMPLSNGAAIALQVLAPFVLGHLARPWIGDWVQRNRAAVMISDRGAILMAVFTAFSAAVIEGVWNRVSPQVLLVLFGVCLLILAVALMFTWGLGHICGFARDERIAILFCGSKKSLVQGVPMARVLFSGADAGLVLLPIMIYHQVQLIASAWIAGRYAKDGEV